ncbi:MAG TPA: DUF177 domain-containing protein [bacterium]|nr:DUF177 domain-containing protein [bacterium]
MRIDVAALEIGQVRRAAFDEVVDSKTEDLAFDTPVRGQVEVDRTAQTLRLRGQLTTTAHLVCGRCLTPYQQDLAIAVEEEFLVGGSPVPRDGALRPEDFVVSLGPDLVLDVTEAVRQHLLLAVPMVPVCRPACRGLCPRCGKNLNEQDCGCEPVETIDPRLAALRHLKDTRRE